MAISRYSIRTRGRQLAQDGPTGPTGITLLLTDPGDYNEAIQQALRIFERDRPNVRVVDQAITVAGFRYALTGGGALSGLTGANAFVAGFSILQELFVPWVVTNQNNEPMDRNNFRVVRDPGGIWVLELTTVSLGVTDIIRLVFTGRHILSEAEASTLAPAAPTAALASPAAAGNADDGLHAIQATYLTENGETDPSPAVNVTVVDKSINGQITVVVAASAQPGITGTRVYMTVAGGAGDKKLAVANATNGGTLTINVADINLGAAAPTTNTAGGTTTVDDFDEDPLVMLAASIILELAAVKAVQNTGNSSLPNDIVDRRTQSDMFRSRSKELREMYATMIGYGGDDSTVKPFSAVKDMDLQTSHGWGYLSRSKRQQ